MSVDGRPRKAKAQQNCEAWFYIDKLSRVQIFVRQLPDGPTVTCEITRRQLAQWIDAPRMRT